MRFLTSLALTLVAGAAAAQPALGTEATPFGSQIPWPSDPDIDTYMDRLEEAGVAWARSEIIWWGLSESTPGSYEFVRPPVEGWESWNADHWVDGLLARGIRPYAILAYGNAAIDPNPENPQDWLPPTSRASQLAYGEWAFHTAARYADRVDIWEIWNEPNISQFWGNQPPNAEDYVNLVTTAAPRIRAADPTAIIVGGVTAHIDIAYLEDCFERGMLEHVDAVSIHPYRTQRPESIADEVARTRELIAEHAPPGKEILLFTGEWGYNTHFSEVDEQGHAKCLARMIVNNLALGIDLSIWFSAHAFEEQDPEGLDSEWGLLNRDLSRRPAFFAMKTMNEHLSAPVAHVDDPFGIMLDPPLEEQRVEVFTHGPGDFTAALWLARWPVNAPFEPEPADVTLDVAEGSSIAAFDSLTGEAISLEMTREAGRVTLRGVAMRDYPIFLEIKNPEE